MIAVLEGLRVDGTTLWLLGGMARLRGDARTPAAEPRVAAAGPVASLLLCAGLGGLALLLGVADAAPLVVGVAVPGVHQRGPRGFQPHPRRALGRLSPVARGTVGLARKSATGDRLERPCGVWFGYLLIVLGAASSKTSARTAAQPS